MMFLSKIRKAETLFACAAFTFVFIFFLRTYDKSITEIQLSYWGAFSKVPWLWNVLIIFLSISIFNNAFLYLKSRPNIKSRTSLSLGFLFLCLNLFVTGAVTMRYQLHTICAVTYFFSFPVMLFLLSLEKSALPKHESTGHIIFSLSMFVLPLSLAKFFPGMGIAESAHSFVVIAWNIWILPKR